jgi:two-component system, chemotaxis family, chemotaxis protein CheY
MNKTLLVVDDARILRLQIMDIAGGAGWDVVGEASDGREAVNAYIKLRPAVVTLDLMMPEYDGLYALRNIMAFDPKAKVVIVSALDQQNVLRDAFKLGASDFILKPFENASLVNTLAQFASERTVAASQG